jgi:hypothetical protein
MGLISSFYSNESAFEPAFGRVPKNVVDITCRDNCEKMFIICSTGKIQIRFKEKKQTRMLNLIPSCCCKYQSNQWLVGFETGQICSFDDDLNQISSFLRKKEIRVHHKSLIKLTPFNNSFVSIGKDKRLFYWGIDEFNLHSIQKPISICSSDFLFVSEATKRIRIFNTNLMNW